MQLEPQHISKLLSDDSTFATVLHIIALKAYGEELYDLDPVEVITRLNEDFHARLTDDNENKLNAILTATATDLFYEDPETFTAVCNTLSSGDPGIVDNDELTMAEIMWAMYEVELNRDPEPFSAAIQALITREAAQEQDDPETAETPTGYLKAFMAEVRDDLQAQLAILGITDPLPPVWAPQPAPVQ